MDLAHTDLILIRADSKGCEQTEQQVSFPSLNSSYSPFKLKKHICCGSGGRLVAHQLEGWWFDPWLLQSTMSKCLGQDTEPQIVPEFSVIGVRLGQWRNMCCVNEWVNVTEV